MKFSFNSSVVRLVDDIRLPWRFSILEFQFQCGAIGRNKSALMDIF